LPHSRYDNADDAILKVSKELNAFVVTNDKVLRDRLKEKNVPRIFLRGKQRLVLER
jgi:rRNA-processing protein FCF1